MQEDFLSDNDDQHLDLPNATLRYLPHFIPDHQSYFDRLQTELDWQQDTLIMCGKPIPVPRLQAWYGDDSAHYSYSGLSLTPKPWVPVLSELRQQLEDFTGEAFNSVLANLYRDGNDSVGWHSDDEPELGRNPVIASLSFGHPRRFSLRSRRNRQIHHLDLAAGSLLVMSGETQHNWHHQIAKTKHCTGPRINLTFRNIVTQN